MFQSSTESRMLQSSHSEIVFMIHLMILQFCNFVDGPPINASRKPQAHSVSDCLRSLLVLRQRYYRHTETSPGQCTSDTDHASTWRRHQRDGEVRPDPIVLGGFLPSRR